MRTIATALAATALASSVLGVTAPQAVAEDRGEAGAGNFGFAVHPKTVQPGGKVDLTVKDCTGHEATAAAGVFNKVTLGMPNQVQSAQVTVDRAAEPGTRYDISFRCGDRTGTAKLSVEGAVLPAEPGVQAIEADALPAPRDPAAQAARGDLGGARADGTAMLLSGAGLSAVVLLAAALRRRRRAAQGA